MEWKRTAASVGIVFGGLVVTFLLIAIVEVSDSKPLLPDVLTNVILPVGVMWTGYGAVKYYRTGQLFARGS